jgi:hypothetical protein
MLLNLNTFPVNKLLSKITLALPFIFAFTCGDQVPDRDSGSINFMIVNDKFESLAGDKVNTSACPQNRYHSDSIRAFDQAGMEVFISPYVLSAIDPCDVSFTLGLQRSGIMDRSKFDLTFFLYLNASETDTIRIVGTGQTPNEIYFNGTPAVSQTPPNVISRSSYYFIKP